MYDDHEPLDDHLARLAAAVRDGDGMLARLHLAEFALGLERRILREERLLAFGGAVESTVRAPFAKVRGEHTSLRHLVALIASALDRWDAHRALEVIGKLRSVLLLHVVKEATLLEPPAIHVH